MDDGHRLNSPKRNGSVVAVNLHSGYSGKCALDAFVQGDLIKFFENTSLLFNEYENFHH